MRRFVGTASAPGWYFDPDSKGTDARYWDGDGWTNLTTGLPPELNSLGDRERCRAAARALNSSRAPSSCPSETEMALGALSMLMPVIGLVVGTNFAKGEGDRSRLGMAIIVGSTLMLMVYLSLLT